MKVRIGVAESDKVVETEVEDSISFEAELAATFANGTELVWFTDTRHRRIGIPRARIAFVEIEMVTDRPQVGFGDSRGS